MRPFFILCAPLSNGTKCTLKMSLLKKGLQCAAYGIRMTGFAVSAILRHFSLQLKHSVSRRRFILQTKDLHLQQSSKAAISAAKKLRQNAYDFFRVLGGINCTPHTIVWLWCDISMAKSCIFFIQFYHEKNWYSSVLPTINDR